MRDEDFELDTGYLHHAAATVARKLAATPIAVDPDIADEMGAFAEDALDIEAALDSTLDAEFEDGSADHGKA